MKKIFAGMMVVTMLVAGQSMLFAADKSEGSKIETGAKAQESIMATTISVEATALTPEQQAEMEKAQQEYEAKFQEVCKKLNYTEEEIMEKLMKGTLTEEEEKALEEAGIVMAVATTEAISLTPEQLAEMEAGDKIFEKEGSIQAVVMSPAMVSITTTK